MIQQFIKCFQFLVMRREYLFSGTFVYAVCQYQFQNLWQTCEVDTGAASRGSAAGDHSHFAVVFQRQEAAGGRFQTAAQTPCTGIIQIHALGAVLTEHKVHTYLVVHPCGIAHA